LGIPKIIFSPESHHPPHPCISGEIRHHPSAQLVVLFVVVSSFSRVVAISPSTPCLLLDKFTAPEFRKVARELSDPFFPSPFFPLSLTRGTRPSGPSPPRAWAGLCRVRPGLAHAAAPPWARTPRPGPRPYKSNAPPPRIPLSLRRRL